MATVRIQREMIYRWHLRKVLARVFTFALGSVVLVVAFVFSVLIFSVVLTAALVAIGWAWWKIRSGRRMRGKRIIDVETSDAGHARRAGRSSDLMKL